MAFQRLGKTLQVAFYYLEPMNSLVVRPCLLTLLVFWGVVTLGKWESRLEVKVYTSVELKLIYLSCSWTRVAQTLT